MIYIATTTFNTRISLKYDTYANWVNKDPVLLAGELADVVVPAATGAVAKEPAILFKAGDGSSKFSQLQFAAGLAAERITDEELEQLNGYLIEIGQHIANNDMDKIVEVDTAFHDMLYTASRNERLRSIINNLREQMTTIRGRSMSYPGRLVETMDEHRNLVEAIAAHDVERAQYAARIHLENAEHTLMRSLSEHLPQKKA